MIRKFLLPTCISLFCIPAFADLSQELSKLHNQYCLTYTDKPNELKQLLEKDGKFSKLDGFDATYETVIDSFSVAITPDKELCTVDFQLQTADVNKEQLLNALKSNHIINIEGIRKEEGVNGQSIDVHAARLTHSSGRHVLVLFPTEKTDNFYASITTFREDVLF